MSPIRERNLIFRGSPDLVCEVVRSRKRKKTFTLQVRRDGTITLHVPYKTTKEETDRFFREKELWVRKKLKDRESAPEPVDPEKKFIQGEKFFYLGEPYPLEIVEPQGRASLTLSYGTFVLRSDKLEDAERVFVDWYRTRAKEEFTRRVHHHSSRLRLLPAAITVTSARSRYGSCSAKNRLSLSWRLIMAPYSVIDYVILHELAHIKEKNHSRKFWDFLETIMPGYKTQRGWLREHGHLLRI
jgi:predicted metal-dependent hydrolase